MGKFLDPYHLEVTPRNGGGRKMIKFDKVIIAAGSQAIKLPFMPDDPRVVDSTDALELRQVPKSMLVIGGGIIGLEMATVYSTLGARIDVVEMLDGLMTGRRSRPGQACWEKKNAGRFDKVMLKTKTVSARSDSGRHQGHDSKARKRRRAANLRHACSWQSGAARTARSIGAEKAGIDGERPRFHSGRQADAHQRAAHLRDRRCRRPADAGAQGSARGATSRRKRRRDRTASSTRGVIPSVAYTDPEVAWAGLTEDQCKAQGLKYGKAVFPWAASGRAIANGRDEGFTKLLFDESNHRLIGGGIVGTHAGDLIGEICLAVEMGCDPVDIGKTIYPHPTLSELIGMAAEVFEGVCTDLPPTKRK